MKYGQHRVEIKSIKTTSSKKDQIAILEYVSGKSRKDCKRLFKKGGTIRDGLEKKICSRINESLNPYGIHTTSYKGKKKVKFKKGYR